MERVFKQMQEKLKELTSYIEERIKEEAMEVAFSAAGGSFINPIYEEVRIETFEEILKKIEELTKEDD